MTNSFIENDVIVNGINLHYHRLGQGNAPIVFFHGFSDDGTCWQPVMNALQADYDMIALDAYGHGKSERIDPAKRQPHSELLHQFIQTLGLQKPVVVGHSMGADAAANCAADHPDAISALILEDIPWHDPDPAKPEISWLPEYRKDIEKMKTKTVEHLIQSKRKVSPNWQEEILLPWVQSKQNLDLTVFDLPFINSRPWRETAKAIQCPVLMVTGDPQRGGIITPQIEMEVLSLMARVEVGHISHAGHCIRYEQFAPYMAMIKYFLKRAFK